MVIRLSAAEIIWRAWTPAALAEAAASQRPIFLFLAPAWSERAREMRHGALRDPQVVAHLNREFVSIAVDPDERPDLGSRYGLGAWPSTCILVGEGDYLTGGTFFNPDELMMLLDEVTRRWSLGRAGIMRQIERYRTGQQLPELLVDRLEYGLIDVLEERVLQDMDLEHGGFGTAPKYPPIEALEYLLIDAPDAEHMPAAPLVRGLAHTLSAMAAGEVHARDRIGGFYRLAASADWSDPANERTLLTNARLLRLYAAAAYQYPAGTTPDDPAWAPEREAWRSTGRELVGLLDALRLDAAEPRRGWSRAYIPGAGPCSSDLLSSAAAARALIESYRLSAADLVSTAQIRDAFLWLSSLSHEALTSAHLSAVTEVGEALISACLTTGDLTWWQRSLSLARAVCQRRRSDWGGLCDVDPAELAGLGLREAATYPEQNAAAAAWLSRLDWLGHRQLGRPPEFAHQLEPMIRWGAGFFYSSGWEVAAWGGPLLRVLALANPDNRPSGTSQT